MPLVHQVIRQLFHVGQACFPFAAPPEMESAQMGKFLPV